jgi:hypothetical protein
LGRAKYSAGINAADGCITIRISIKWLSGQDWLALFVLVPLESAFDGPVVPAALPHLHLAA